MKRVTLIATLAIAAAIGYWAIAQPAPAPLPTIMPPGALLYLEAKDFGALASDWDASAEKRAWIAGANYQAFSRSRLFLRLEQAQGEFAAAAGLAPDYALLRAVAGGNSALAIYNIGDLQFLYVTRIASGRALETALWKARTNYQARKAGGVTYYLKQDPASHRQAAFAYTGGILLLSTDGDLLAGALELIAGTGRPALASEAWFNSAVNAAQPGGNDLRMIYNLERLTASPHFRSYWIQRNISSLREFAGGLADLERAGSEFRERRVLVRANTAAPVSDESAAGRALALVPDNAGFYRVRLKPEADAVMQAIEAKIFASGAVPSIRQTAAPVVSDQPEVGSESDLETRIDEQPLTNDRDVFAPLRTITGALAVQAILEVSSTRVDSAQIFVRPDSAIALLASTRWDADAMRAAIGASAAALWSNGSAGSQWRTGANGIEQLDSIAHVAIAADDRLLVLGTSPEIVSAVFARRTRPAAPGAIYAAGWRHAAELPNFELMFRLIDFPQLAPPGSGEQSHEPMFFSENLASLGRALVRVNRADIAIHDAGAMLRETVVYRVAP